MGSIPGLEDPLEEEMVTHSSNLSQKTHGQRCLVGYSLWGCKRANVIEQLNNNNEAID